MNLLIEIVGLGMVLPAGIAISVAVLGRRFFSSDDADKYGPVLGAGLGFCVGYILLPPWAELTPQRHWQWLPYLGALATAVALSSQALFSQRFIRWMIFAALALVAAWCVVPTWPDFRPSRPVTIALLAVYVFVIITTLDALPQRLAGPLFCGLLAAVSFVLAIALAVTVSAKFAQVGLLAAAALGGVYVTSKRAKQEFARGLVPVFAVLSGSLAYVGAIEPTRPLWGMLLIPAAPLSLWACASGPLSRLHGIKAGLVQVGLVVLPLVAATVCVLMAEGS